MSKICSCFGGFKNIKKVGIKESLEVLFEYLIDKDKFDVFCFGGLGEFDELCFEVVSKLKQRYKNISLTLILPQNKTLAREIEFKQKGRFDKTITMTNKEVLKLPILSRNIEMAKASEFVVFYANENGNSNESKVLKIAKERHIPFVNLF